MPCFIELILIFYHFISAIAKNFGIIIAALIAFYGVTKQLHENRKWKTKEHDLNLKKDVYLAAVEAVWAAMFAMSQLVNANQPDSEILKEYSKKAPDLSKARFLADPVLRYAFQNFTVEYSLNVLDLCIKRQPFLAIHQQISRLEATIEEELKFDKSLVEIMRELNLTNVLEAPKWDAIMRQHNLSQQNIQNLQRELDILYQKNRDEFSNLFAKIQEYIANLRLLSLPIEEFGRKELSLIFDKETEKQKLDEELKKIEIAIQNLMSGVGANNSIPT